MKSIGYGLVIFGCLVAMEILGTPGSTRLVVADVELHRQDFYKQMHQSVEVTKNRFGDPVIVLKDTPRPKALQFAAVISVLVALGHWTLSGRNQGDKTKPAH